MPSTDHFPLTKIVATVGPASQSEQIIGQMILEGARAFRLNLSHGTIEQHRQRVATIRQASSHLGIPVAVFADLCGPRIRVGQLPDGGIQLQEGQGVLLSNEPPQAQPPEGGPGPVALSLNSARATEQVGPGHRILIADGAIRLICNRRHAAGLDCTVQVGGRVSSNMGVNLPDTALSIPALTQRDYQHIRFAVEMQLDYIGLSFVQSGQDIRLLKDELTRLGARPADGQLSLEDPIQFSAIEIEAEHIIPIIAKIERPGAVANLESILEQTDAIMVARGDLGVEMDLAELPVIQKRIIRTCQGYGIPVIVATQMLQSMVNAPTPTRAEASDVANAIFDGADAVMLSAETSIGRYPVESVRMMSRIAQTTHHYIRLHRRIRPDRPQVRRGPLAAALADGVRVMAEDLDIRLLAIWSRLGGSAVYLAQQRIPRPALAFSSRPGILQRLALLYGLTPVHMHEPDNLDAFVRQLDRLCLENKWAAPGEHILVVWSQPGGPRADHTVCVHRIGQADAGQPVLVAGHGGTHAQ